MSLAELGEFGIIERFAKRLERPIENLVTGIGDDCAVIRPAPGRHTLITSDMMVAGVHFLLDRTEPSDLGHKALCTGLSDIAAMGGRPVCFFLSLALPGGTPVSWLERFFDGLGALATEFGVTLAGGDTVASPVVAVDITVLGQGEPKNLVRRKGARAGDLILVTGYLGASAAGLHIIKNEIGINNLPGRLHEAAALACHAHRRPWPRLREAAVLVRDAPPTSMMDISDGLAGDLRHITGANGVGAEIWAGSLPMIPGLQDLAAELGNSADLWALSGGEDYELLLTLPEPQAEAAMRAVRGANGTPLTVVGRITDSLEVVFLDRQGRQFSPIGGHDHFGGHQ